MGVVGVENYAVLLAGCQKRTGEGVLTYEAVSAKRLGDFDRASAAKGLFKLPNAPSALARKP